MSTRFEASSVNWPEIMTRGNRIIRSRLIGNLDDREDCLDQSLLFMVRALDRGLFAYRGEGSFEKYASTICINTAKKFNRKVANRQRRIMSMPDNPDCSDSFISQTANRLPSPETTAVYREIMENVRQIIAGLDPEVQVLFSLKYEKGLKDKEIAQKLGISTEAVKSRFFRLRKILREELKSRDF